MVLGCAEQVMMNLRWVGFGVLQTQSLAAGKSIPRTRTMLGSFVRVDFVQGSGSRVFCWTLNWRLIHNIGNSSTYPDIV